MSDFPDRYPAEGEYHINIRTSSGNNAITDSADTPDGGGDKNLLIAMDLDNYKTSYDGYTFFQSAFVAVNDVTEVTFTLHGLP